MFSFLYNVNRASLKRRLFDFAAAVTALCFVNSYIPQAAIAQSYGVSSQDSSFSAANNASYADDNRTILGLPTAEVAGITLIVVVGGLVLGACLTGACPLALAIVALGAASFAHAAENGTALPPGGGDLPLHMNMVDTPGLRPASGAGFPTTFSGVATNGADSLVYQGTRDGSTVRGTYNDAGTPGRFTGSIFRSGRVSGSYSEDGETGTFTGQATPKLDKVIGSSTCTSNC